MFTSLGPYGALDHHFTVDTDRRVAPSIAALLRPLELRRQSPTTASYRLDPITSAQDGEFLLSRDGTELGSALDERTAVELLLWSVDQAALRDSDRYVLVHASAAERDGRAVVLPGPSGAGKSTLVCALVARGWHYLTDEIVALDPTDGGLVAYPRAAKLEGPPAHPFDHPVTPCPTDSDVHRFAFDAGAAHEIAMVVMPSIRPAAGEALEPVEAVDAIATLAACCWNLQSHRQDGLDLLAAIARRPCWRVALGDPDAAAASIEAALDQVLVEPDAKSPA